MLTTMAGMLVLQKVRIDKTLDRNDRELENINQALENSHRKLENIKQNIRRGIEQELDHLIKNIESMKRNFESAGIMLDSMHESLTEARSAFLQGTANEHCGDDTARPKTEDTAASAEGNGKGCASC